MMTVSALMRPHRWLSARVLAVTLSLGHALFQYAVQARKE